MIKLMDLLIEAGAAAGTVELVKTPLVKARELAEKLYAEKGKTLDEEIPDFDANYKKTQKSAGLGKTQRKDMPVIEDKDVKDLQMRLSKGYIDFTEPHAKPVKGTNPFPQGLSGKDAKQWLENGLKRHDGAKSDADDVVKVNKSQVEVGKLKPIQKQIYFDKIIHPIVDNGAGPSKNFYSKSVFIVSADNYIIDGHHRYAGAFLLDPTMKVTCLVIDLPINVLLPMSLAYGDAIGNKRNQ